MLSEIDFRGFSTRSFEHFTQAMAAHVLGPGCLVYGDGPDGAREATYEGFVPFPSDAERWDGYIVMQAKFLQRPRDPSTDADWLAQELREELDKFLDKRRGLRAPTFYLLATNVVLSPVPESSRGKGGLVKIDEVFAKYKDRLGIRDYRVWHHDQLRALLDDAPAIRQSYAAWLTSSDVIAELLKSFKAQTADFESIMLRLLQRELRTQRITRLQQAGHSSDNPTKIEDVFTDLPFLEEDWFGLSSEPEEGLLKSLIARSREKLDPDSIASDTGFEPRPDRFLILGGPGQGKSTVTQFLAQLYRAKALEGQSSESIKSCGNKFHNVSLVN
jgi:hypothetical protein